MESRVAVAIIKIGQVWSFGRQNICDNIATSVETSKSDAHILTVVAYDHKLVNRGCETRNQDFLGDPRFHFEEFFWFYGVQSNSVPDCQIDDTDVPSDETLGVLWAGVMLVVDTVGSSSEESSPRAG